jgi:hypothetical protein
MESQIPHKFEVEEKEVPTLEEPYVPSIGQPQHEVVKPTCIVEEEEIPIIKEDTPIPELHELPTIPDVEAPLAFARTKEVESEQLEPSFEDVPRSLELSISDAIEESQGDVGSPALDEDEHVSEVHELQIPPKFEAQENEAPPLVEPKVPSSDQPQDKDVQPTSTEEEEKTPAVEEYTSHPNEGLEELPQDGAVEVPFDVQIEKQVESKEVEPSFKEVSRSLELPISHPIEESQGDVGIQALHEDELVSEVHELQIPPMFEAQENDAPTLVELDVPSTDQPQDKGLQSTSTEEEEKTPTLKEDTSHPIKALEELPQDGDVEAPFDVQIEKKVESEEVEPSFEEVPRSSELPSSHSIEETQGDVGVKALQKDEHVSEVEEPQIEPPITESQIPHKFEVEEKEFPTLEEPYVPSIGQPQHEDVKPTSIEDEEETPIIMEDTSTPTQELQELSRDADVEEPLAFATTKEVEPEQVEPSFEEVPRSLELSISHPIEESQGDVGIQAVHEDEHVSEVHELQIPPKFEAQENDGATLVEPDVPSFDQPQDEDVQPTSTEEEEKTPTVKEDTSHPIEGLEELPQDGDVEAPFDVQIEKKVESKEVEPGFEEVPRSFEFPISHPIEETQGNVGVESLQEGEHVSEVEEPQIEPAIMESQIVQKFEAQEKEAPIVEEPYVASIEQPQLQDVKPTSIEEEEEIPIAEEDTSAPIQALHELPQDSDIHTPFEAATKKEVELEQGEPSFEEVPRSLELPNRHAIGESQGDVGVNSLQEGEQVFKVEEPQIPRKFDFQEKEAPTLEEPIVPSITQLENKLVQPTSIKEEGAPIVKEDTSEPIQSLDELPQDGDLEAPFAVPTEKKVEHEEVEPSLEEVPRSFELPISQLEETKGNVGIEALVKGQDVSKVEEHEIEVPIMEPEVLQESNAQNKKAPILEEQHIPSTKKFEVEDVKPASIKGKEETPIVKEDKNILIQTLDEFPQHGDVEEPFEVPMKEEVESSFEEVPRPLELPISPPIGETQEHVGIEVPISPPIEETQEDVEIKGFQLVEDASPLENVRSILIQQAPSVEGDNWRTWKRELEANAMDKLFAQENLTPTKESKNGGILEGPWPRVGSALEESIVSTKDPCGNEESEALNYLSCQKYHIYVLGNVHLM